MEVNAATMSQAIIGWERRNMSGEDNPTAARASNELACGHWEKPPQIARREAEQWLQSRFLKHRKRALTQQRPWRCETL